MARAVTRFRSSGRLSRSDSIHCRAFWERPALLEKAYGMVPQPTAFPHAESCPAVDRTDTQPTTNRVDLKDGAGGEEIRRLYAGESLKVISTEGKWSEVQQLDGSTGWVKTKRAFK